MPPVTERGPAEAFYLVNENDPPDRIHGQSTEPDQKIFWDTTRSSGERYPPTPLPEGDEIPGFSFRTV